ASESNNAGFYVEHRASDADDYSDYTFVEGAGTTDEPQAYQIAIDDLELGVHTFRLRQVDTDGTTTHHGPVDAEVTLAEPYRVDAPYPNPAHAQATLGFAVQEAQPVTVTLYDVMGRRVQTLYEDTPTPDRLETLQVPVAPLSSGAYFVRVQGENFTETRRLTVVR
ncbi:MAG: T9SS type A sorting domain-containing protein, partial [Longimonas sp.]|uniref:T9SS type A sorting domain-containing protein n=1 Tax=Longimonas sp. TaxID=2039626 RepID=UPI003344FDD7